MTTTKRIAPWIAAAAIAASFGFAPIAAAAPEPASVISTTSEPAPVGSAGADPLVPYGTDPQIPYQLGYVDPNHDNADTTDGQVDLPG